MTELKLRATTESLVLQDPRQYGKLGARNGLMAAIRSAGAGGHTDRVAYNRILAEAAECVMNGDNEVLNEALRCARNAEEHATAESLFAYVSCQGLSMADHETVHLVFGIPLTVQPEDWPDGQEAAPEITPPENWFDFDLLAVKLRAEGMVPGDVQLELLPHFFGAAALRKLTWSDWYQLAMILPLQPDAALAHLPKPKPVQPFQERSAQARLVLGAISGTPSEVRRFISSAVTQEAPYVATLVEHFQSRMDRAMGGQRRLRVIAGVPSTAVSAVSNGGFMNNLAQLRSLTDLVDSDVSEMLSFRAEVHPDVDGGGRVRFLTRSTSYDWRLSKSATWKSQQTHWGLLLSRSPARYLRIQLGLGA